MTDSDVEWDAMRIPSTKRICFVGNYCPQVAQRAEKIEKFIQLKKSKSRNQQFALRDVEEELRSKNCQKINKDVRREILKVRCYYFSQISS